MLHTCVIHILPIFYGKNFQNFWPNSYLKPKLFINDEGHCQWQLVGAGGVEQLLFPEREEEKGNFNIIIIIGVYPKIYIA